MCTDHSDLLKKWVALALLTLSPSAAAQTAFHFNGAFASASACSFSATTAECFTVDVGRGPTATGQESAFLSYDHSVTDLTTGIEQDTLGFGTIPGTAFLVSAKTDSLNVDTSTVANFVNEVCTFDPSTSMETCNSIAGGLVTGTWTRVPNLFSTSFSGTSTETSLGATQITTGTFNSSDALANLNILGAVATNVSAFVGTNHNTNLSIQRH